MTQQHQESEEFPFHILRGRRIEEFSHQDLITLHKQINDELPTLIDQLGSLDMSRLYELELIEDELHRRHERFE